MNVEEIYNMIGNSLFSYVNEEYQDWEQVTILIKKLPESVSYETRLSRNGEEDDLGDFDLTLEEIESIHELHKITTKGGNNKWNRAKFTVTPDGKFNMDFIWDQELQDEYEKG